MSRNFYTGTDAELATGSANLISIVTPVPATYGVTSGIVTSYTAKADTYSDLYALISNPATRTPSKIIAKNAAKKVLRAATVDIARMITATPTVTNEMLNDLKLNLRVVPQPIPAPAVAPGILIKSVNQRLVTLRLVDQEHTSRRGKPPGTAGAAIFSHIGETVPESISDWVFEGNTSDVNVEVQFPVGTAPGAKVWFTAFWFNNRKESSPKASAVSTNVQGGGITLAA